MSRKISAQLVLSEEGNFLPRGVVEVGPDGQIRSVSDTGGQLKEEAGLEFYNGILCPGFVNAHVHTELSHLRGKIPEGTGLAAFLQEVRKYADRPVPEHLLKEALTEMEENGIVLAGDICNTAHSFQAKTESAIAFHNFIEIFGFHPREAAGRFDQACQLQEQSLKAGMPASLVPHAPYSVSAALLKSILQHPGEPLSVHFRETASEAGFCTSGTGPLAAFYSQYLGIRREDYPDNFRETEEYLQLLAAKQHWLLIHLTFVSETELKQIRDDLKHPFLVVCPRANTYIEGRLPDLALLRASGIPLAVGTDGLSSNSRLSILNELALLQENAPEIPLNELLTWATFNGAKALGREDEYGSFSPGKKPGILLLEKADLQNRKLNGETRIRKIG